MAVSEDMKSSQMSSSKRRTQTNDNNSGLTNGPKRRRDADQKILDHFWLICDPNQSKRNKSLKIIIQILIKQNESDNSNDLMYCLDRVIRGMASARQFARHGFCVLLTQMLSIFESKVTLDLVFNLCEKHLGKMDELSNHDSVIGWSLVMASLIKSQRLNSENNPILEQTFNVLYTLGMSNKPYVELVICELIPPFLDIITHKEFMSQNISKRLKEDLKTENKYKPFFAFICLSLLEHFPKLIESDELKYMDNDSLQSLSIMVRESTAYHPSVHPFHRLIIKCFISKNETEFSDFWNQCIDCVLFTPNQIEKGYLGFELIKIGLQLSKTTESISTIVSPSFVRLFIQSLSVQTHPLYSASKQLCNSFNNFIKNVDESELQLEFVTCFTKPPGSLLFDDISKSKFFSNLLRNLNITSIREWTQKLKNIFLTTNKMDSNDILRIRCIQQISNLCKSLASNEDTDTLWSNIKFLFFHTYFDVNGNSQTTDDMLRNPVVPISEKLRNSLKDSFRNAFNLILHMSSKTSKEKLTHETNTLSSMVKFINELLSIESIKCLANSDCLEPFHTIVHKVLRLKKKLKQNALKEREIKIFISLYSVAAIQLFEEYEEIQNIIPDLNECMKRAINEESVEENSSPVWSDVLTELILSLLTTTSKLTKNVLFSCFKHICTQITNTGIERLIDAIKPSNDKLFDGNEDSDDEDIEEEDVEEENVESDSQSDSGDENEDENPEIDEKFRNDVINALGPAADNQDDEESVYLSDNEMFQIDEILAQVFKTKYSDKKDLAEKNISIIAFRLRCLELIEIFLNHKDISLDQVFMFIDPLVSVAKTWTQSLKQNQLSFKAINLIQQMTKIRDSGDNSLDIKDFNNILNNLLIVLAKSINSELQKVLISLIIWMITLSKKLFVDNDWYSSDIETALKSFFEKNNCQTPALFLKNLISVHSDIGFKLYDTFLEYGFREDIRPYKKSTAIEILLFLAKTKNTKSMSRKQLIAIREKCLRVLCDELTIENLRAQYVSELLKLFSWTDKNLKDQNPELKVSDNEFEELSTKLKSLSKNKKKKLDSKEIIKKLILNAN